ncbi:hypothetical protein EON77_15870 [bacterium]|nr:MAG: hypothetical protein EON77_15870 [bacterium]
MTNIELARSLLSSPRRFFAQLEEHPRYALPFWLGLLATVGLTAWYYGVVDIEWLKQLQMDADPRTAAMSDAQREAAARFLTRGLLLGFGLAAILAIGVLTRLLEALYYRAIGPAFGLRRTYRQWFAFSSWTALPHVVAALPAVLVLLVADTAHLAPGAMQPLSFNELFFHRPLGAPGYNFLSIVGVGHVVTLALAVYGVKCWSKRSWGFAALFVLGPALVAAIGFGIYAGATR